MIPILQENRRPSLGEQFGQAFGNLGQAAGQAIPQYFQEQEEIEAFKRMGIDAKGFSPEQRKLLLAEKSKNTFGEELGIQDYETVKGYFGEKFADLWKAAPTGGKTKLIEWGIDTIQRGGNLEEELEAVDVSESFSSENDAFNEEEVIENFKKQDKSLKPVEKVKRENERYKTNLPIYQEASKKLKGIKDDQNRIAILESLEKSKKLPTGLQRVNVDEEGNLRLPFFASPDAQRFVKTINEFSQGAKNSFGARVTQFELAQFMKRFPTLLNTSEGRKQLYEQMKIINDVNSVYYKNLRDVYKKAGGVRKIDADIAEGLAEQKSEPQIQKLVSKFDSISKIASLPNPTEFEGKKIRDTETGEIFISDGNEWVPQ